MKTCPRCTVEKKESEFHKNKRYRVAELDKTVILCSNCHRMLHAGEITT